MNIHGSHRYCLASVLLAHLFCTSEVLGFPGVVLKPFVLVTFGLPGLWLVLHAKREAAVALPSSTQITTPSPKPTTSAQPTSIRNEADPFTGDAEIPEQAEPAPPQKAIQSCGNINLHEREQRFSRTEPLVGRNNVPMRWHLPRLSSFLLHQYRSNQLILVGAVAVLVLK